jgi:hypothetical protein
MKKIIIIILLLTTLPFSIFSQKHFNSYYNQYSNESYSIRLSEDDNDLIKYRLYIDMISLDTAYNNSGGIVMNSDRHNEFLFQLNEAKFQYEKYSNLCMINKITDWTNMMQNSVSVSSYYKNNKNIWMIKNNVELTFYFRVIGEDKFLIISTNMVDEDLNEFNDDSYDINGFIFIFSSTKEIDNFIEIINIDKINMGLINNNLSQILK